MTAAATTPPPPPPGQRPTLVLEIDSPQRQRRWTVLLRAVLFLPHAIALTVLGIVVSLASIPAWFAALFTGRLPDWAWRLIVGYLHWAARAIGYVVMLTDRYPPMSRRAHQDYPVRLLMPEPGRLNRAAVLFRVFLNLPAALVTNIVTSGLGLLSPLAWIWVLVTGRSPSALSAANTAVLRWYLRNSAYMYMTTSTYPNHLYGDRHHDQTDPLPSEYPSPVSTGAGVLLLGTAAKILLTVYLILGAGYLVASVYIDVQTAQQHARRLELATAPTVPGSSGAAPDTGPASAQSTLLSHVPDALHPSCVPDPVDNSWDQAYARNLAAAIRCDLAGANAGAPDRVTYYQYSDPQAETDAYNHLLTAYGNRFKNTNTSCAQGTPGSGPYQGAGGPSDVPGYMLCGVGSTRGNFLAWTDDAHNLLAEIDSNQMSIAQLNQFWSSYQLIQP